MRNNFEERFKKVWKMKVDNLYLCSIINLKFKRYERNFEEF